MSTSLQRSSVNAKILRLSLPTMTGMLLQALYDLVDMFWIGFISPSAIAAATLFNTFFWMVEVLNEIVGTSSVSLISQSHGANETQKRDRISEQTLLFKFLLAVLGAVLLALLLPSLFRLFTSDEAVQRYGLDYGMIRVLFLPLFFSSYSVNTIFRCTGDAKTPMKLMIGSAVLNMIADPLLMFDTIPGTSIPGAGWGIKGAAIATVGSITLAFAIGFGLLLAGKSEVKLSFIGLITLDPPIAKQLFSIGAPSGAGLLLRNLSMALFLKMVALHGTEAVAVAGIGFRIYSFGFMPGWGLSMGSGIVIGHAIGKNNIEEAKRAVVLTTVDCLLIVGVLALPIFLFPKQVLSLFMGGQQAGPIGIALMRTIAPALLFSALNSGMGAAFTGAGKNKPLLLAGIVGQWGILVPCSLLATLVFPGSTVWLWAILLIADGGELVSRFFFYRRLNWYKSRVRVD
ncbi:MAG: MATE family efflux transporter [Sphaerochaetaceae bacterium]